MVETDNLAKRLVPHYSHFDVGNRLLFTGHSHQAWPDVALEGLKESFRVTAEKIDDKWPAAFEKTIILRKYLRKFYDDPDGLYSLSSSTHNLIVRWLSALDLVGKPRIITTDSEFHSMNRQLTRLEEEGIEIVRVPAFPLDGFSERIEKVMNDKTAAIMISHIYFGWSLINNELKETAAAARKYGIPLLIDDYHGTNVVPMSIRDEGLDDCYLLIGGYKYLQWGEGNCFLRYPANCTLRPVITGWFAAFEKLSLPQKANITEYDEGNNRFVGATYDSVSQFRAARVADFFNEMKLTPTVLKENYQMHVTRLKEEFLKLDLNPETIKLKHDYPVERNAGFLAFESKIAGSIHKKLKKYGVMTDFRDQTLRFGPAPFTTSQQIAEAMHILRKSVYELL